MFECDSCRLDLLSERGLSALNAGEAASKLAVCGYETAAARLPMVYAADQNYTAGLCPGLALEKGTMFPELVSEY